jgi:hypothetical protein
MPQASEGAATPGNGAEKVDEARESGQTQAMPLPKYFAELYTQFPEL